MFIKKEDLPKRSNPKEKKRKEKEIEKEKREKERKERKEKKNKKRGLKVQLLYGLASHKHQANINMKIEKITKFNSTKEKNKSLELGYENSLSASLL